MCIDGWLERFFDYNFHCILNECLEHTHTHTHTHWQPHIRWMYTFLCVCAVNLHSSKQFVFSFQEKEFSQRITKTPATTTKMKWWREKKITVVIILKNIANYIQRFLTSLSALYAWWFFLYTKSSKHSYIHCIHLFIYGGAERGKVIKKMI